jgi:hypothetical protein
MTWDKIPMKKLSLFILLLIFSNSPLRAEPASTQIANAIQKGGFVYIYNEKGGQIGCVGAGSGPKDGLVGYTGSTVSVRKGDFIYNYNAQGGQTGCVSAK